MTPERRAEINRANALKSTGPKTAEGKAKASMNARKHGMRSKRESIFSDTSYRYEERLRKWMAHFDAQDDAQEFLVATNVSLSFDIERAGRADAANFERAVEESPAKELAEVHETGRQLFYDPCGATAIHGVEPALAGKVTTSGNGPNGEPYTKPGELVRKLESSATGCCWMLAEWARLRKRAEKNYWSGADRLRAVRLLGRQPIDAIDDRRVATIYIASNCIKSFGEPAFHDLRSDLSEPGITQFAKLVKVRWRGLSRPLERAQCRRLLVELVDRQVGRLNAVLARHEEMSDVYDERAVADAGFGSDKRSHQIRQHKLSCVRALYRGMGALEKCKGRKRSEGVGLRGEEIRRTEARGWRAEGAAAAQGGGVAGGEMSAECDGGRVADIGENVTNEANLCENASMSENHESVQVTAISDGILGLDKLETKPAEEWGGEAVLDEEEGVGEGGLGGDCDGEGDDEDVEPPDGHEEVADGAVKDNGRGREPDKVTEVRELQAFIARGMAEAAALGVPPEEFMRRVVARSPGAMKFLAPLLESGP